ncbi:hypothetical protein Dimus_009587 [Dionaea muscipula]
MGCLCSAEMRRPGGGGEVALYCDLGIRLVSVALAAAGFGGARGVMVADSALKLRLPPGGSFHYFGDLFVVLFVAPSLVLALCAGVVTWGGRRRLKAAAPVFPPWIHWAGLHLDLVGEERVGVTSGLLLIAAILDHVHRLYMYRFVLDWTVLGCEIYREGIRLYC